MKLKVAIVSMFMIHFLVGSAISPALVSISEFINDNNMGDGDTLVRQFLVFPTIFIILLLFFSGQISSFFHKKHLILTGFSLILIGGIGGIFAYNVFSVFFFRGMIGVGGGLILPYLAPLVADYYTSEQRSSLYPYTGAFTFTSALIMLLFSGILANIHWRLSFLIFLFPLICIYLVYHYVPIIYRPNKRKYPFVFSLILKPIVFKVCIIYFFISFLAYNYFVGIPFLVHNKLLGTSLDIALIQAVGLLGAVVANLVLMLRFVRKVDYNIVFAVQGLCIFVGLLIFGIFETYLAYYLGSLSFWLGYGGLNVVFTNIITNNTSRLNRVNAFSLFTLLIFLAQFVSVSTFNTVLSSDNIDYPLIFLSISPIFLAMSLIATYMHFVRKFP